MYAILFFGGMLIGFLVVIGIPIAITYFSYKYLNKKFSGKPYKYTAFIPTLFLLYCVWFSIFPGEDFYKEDFKEVTQLDFPKNSNFIYKSATFPDYFGDYSSTFLFKSTTEEYEIIRTQLIKLNFKYVPINTEYTPEIKTVLHKNQLKPYQQYIYQVEAGKIYCVDFFNDHKTILIIRDSW